MLFPASHLDTGLDGISRSESSIIWGPSFLFRFRKPKVCAIGNSFLSKSCGRLALEGVRPFFTGNTPQFCKVANIKRECYSENQKPTKTLPPKKRNQQQNIQEVLMQVLQMVLFSKITVKSGFLAGTHLPCRQNYLVFDSPL